MERMIDVGLLIAEFEKVYPLATNEMGGVVNKRIYDIINSIPTVPESSNRADTVALLENIKKEIRSTYYSQGDGYDDFPHGYMFAKKEDMRVIDKYIQKCEDQK